MNCLTVNFRNWNDNLVPSGTRNKSLPAPTTFPTHRNQRPRSRNSSGLCIIESCLQLIQAYTNQYVYGTFLLLSTGQVKFSSIFESYTRYEASILGVATESRRFTKTKLLLKS